jgi:hypothetical protein
VGYLPLTGQSRKLDSGDIDGNGQVDVVDILVVIDRWGICP